MTAPNFGVREWVNLAVFFINYYLRHKDNVDDLLGNEIKDAMMVLVENIDLIVSRNTPGPG